MSRGYGFAILLLIYKSQAQQVLGFFFICDLRLECFKLFGGNKLNREAHLNFSQIEAYFLCHICVKQK
jgi:hypothetical protein|tara:strand:- start:877 stop:1080 length:204 start_codon:yes stop_codon:yes gene_type:complete